MRILFLTNLYPPYDVGGYEQLCWEVAEDLKQRGHEIRILTSRYGVSDHREGNEDHISRSLFLQTDLEFYNPWSFFFLRPIQDRLNYRTLRNEIQSFRPDVLMVWGMWNLSQYLPYWSEELMPGRVAYYVSSYWPLDEDPHREYWKLPARHKLNESFKQLLRRIAFFLLEKEGYPPQLSMSKVMCCSEYVKNTLITAGKLPSSAGVIYIGTNADDFRINAGQLKQNNEINLLYFGRLIRDKGVHTAIEALSLLKKRGLGDRFSLTIIGSGHPEYEQFLHQQVSDLNIHDLVTFVGKIAREDIPEWLSKYDVFLFTSIWPEPFARTIGEAMASGLVVIGSRVGGSPEIFKDYGNQLLFEPGDAGTLADHIQLLSENAYLRETLVKSGHKIVEQKYSFEKMLDQFEEFLLNVKTPSI